MSTDLTPPTPAPAHPGRNLDDVWSPHAVFLYPVSTTLLKHWYIRGRTDEDLVKYLYIAYQASLASISFKECAWHSLKAEEFLHEHKSIKSLDKACESMKDTALLDLISTVSVHYLRFWNQEPTKGHAIHPCDGSIQKHPYHKDLDIDVDNTSCPWSCILISVNDLIRKPLKQATPPPKKRSRDEEENEEKKAPAPVHAPTPTPAVNEEESVSNHKKQRTEEQQEEKKEVPVPVATAPTPPPPHPPTPPPVPVQPLTISISSSASPSHSSSSSQWEEEDEMPSPRSQHPSNPHPPLSSGIPTPVALWSAQQCFQQLSPITPSRELSIVSRSDSLVTPKSLSRDFASLMTTTTASSFSSLASPSHSSSSSSSTIAPVRAPSPVPVPAPAHDSDRRLDLDHYESKVLIRYKRDAYAKVPPECQELFRSLMDCRDTEKLVSVWNLLIERADPMYHPYSYFPWYTLKEQYTQDLEWMQAMKKENSNAMWTHIASNIKLFFDGFIDPIHQQSLDEMINESSSQQAPPLPSSSST
jgi:hypothetical protein